MFRSTFWNFSDAAKRSCRELLKLIDERRRHAVELLERLRRHLRERQRVFQVGLAHVEMRAQGRQLDVRHHAAKLGAVAARPIELLHGDLQFAHVRGVGNAEQLLAQIQQALHRALAVGRLVAHDQAAIVVLDGPGENLAGAGAELADEHDQRAVPVDVRIGIKVGVTRPSASLTCTTGPSLMNRPVRLMASVSEPPPLVRRSMTTASTPFSLKPIKDVVHVAGGALVVGLALAGAVHVHVEAGKVDHAHFIGLAVRTLAGLEDLAAGLAVFQLDGRPCDFDLVRLGVLERQ